MELLLQGKDFGKLGGLTAIEASSVWFQLIEPFAEVQTVHMTLWLCRSDCDTEKIIKFLNINCCYLDHNHLDNARLRLVQKHLTSVYDTMATFQPFPRLPYEMRACIWKMTVEPRLVSFEVRRDSFHQRDGRFLTSSNPPAVVQVCREARNYGLYQK